MGAETSPVQALLQDIQRWRLRLPDVESTYCQGIANKAAKHFEVMLKRLAASRTGPGHADLATSLARVRYKGAASKVDKLPLGTVVELLLELAKQSPDLSAACNINRGKTLRSVVDVRNNTTHELPPDEMRQATSRLLDLIEQMLTHPAFSELVEALP
ncbi:MAG: hypothetical protein LC792_15740 [Actinobacteria bacterium]|nr:hypothetical protein [Actinomycetota bacterium]